MNTLFKKFLKVATFATFVAVWLTAGASSAQEVHSYNGRIVYTEGNPPPRNVFFTSFSLMCTPAGGLITIYAYGTNHAFAANVFDRNTGKPVFCDPATGKVFESK